ncbi:MAG TPA: protein kinase [Nannocystaceae bacterium]|nr:protein kinase [Nannocystaceae bacterium]
MAVQVPSHADGLLRRLAGPSGLLADRYRPVEVLGQGGMGVVFHAIDERLGRDVAIKSLRSDLATPDFVARFSSEATALARIHHPNVVQILDVSEPGSPTAYYVMELVRGTPLSKLLRERGSLPWSQAYDVLTQVASALAAVHKAGVVHRDLKPSNLLCAEIGRESWHVELIDFGIAIAPGSPRLTRPGEVLGTLPYMAPEQFAGITIDQRTDVYGWGVLALELLGGVPPAELFGKEELAGAPLRDAAPKVLERARVRPHITAIVRRCLETQPGDRFPDMETVHAELSDRDDGGAPTLIFQRAVPLPRTGTIVPGDMIAASESADDLDAAATSVRERAAVTSDASLPVAKRPTAPADSAPNVPVERTVPTPASAGRTVPTPMMTMPEPAPRSRGPMRLAIAALVVSTIGSAAWVAHAYGVFGRRHCARIEGSMHAWPVLAIPEPAPAAPVEAPAVPAVEPVEPEPAAPAEAPIDAPPESTTAKAHSPDLENPFASRARKHDAPPPAEPEPAVTPEPETPAPASAPRKPTKPGAAGLKDPFVRDPFEE